MVLNNYWKAINILKSMSISGASGDSFGILDYTGSAVSILKGYDAAKWPATKINVNLRDDNIGVRLGSGTGTIAPTDYALFNDITSSISNLQVSSSCDATDNGYRQVLTISGTNNGESAITITEVGITKIFSSDYSTTMGVVYYTNPVMFAKILLDEPITVEANGAFSFTIEWLEG